MPYNTRRKSLSLPSLGIQLPNSSRSSSHRSPPANTTSTSTEQQPPAKRVKRSHSSSDASSPPASPPRITTVKFRDERPKSAGRAAQHTPPPSPGETGSKKIDTQGIDDDIVVGVIEQLEKTGNRPHLLKELAAVLSTTLPIVESSANPSAIISSRLATYLKRSWTALAPCPLGKELIGTHPKRIYFFLTTTPRQAFPDTAQIPQPANRIVSPSLTSASAADEEDEDSSDARARQQLSPSPEIDLSSPELDDASVPNTRGGAFSPRAGSLPNDGPHVPSSVNMSHNRRAVSPPLERDEREFTQTASSLQQRSRSQDVEAEPSIELPSNVEEALDAMDETVPAATDESEESAARKNSEAAALLFGHADGGQHLGLPPSAAPGSLFASSPVIRPLLEVDTGVLGGKEGSVAAAAAAAAAARVEVGDVRVLDDDAMDVEEATWTWAELKSPENVELDELDDLFESY